VSTAPVWLVTQLRAAGCVFAEQETQVLAGSATGEGHLRNWADRRCAGEPLEYVVGWAQFGPLRLHVRRGVFIPRARTGLLAQTVLARIGVPGIVVDMCCGTGALAAVVQQAHPGAEVWACDIDPAAVACAGFNLKGPVLRGDLFDALPEELRGRVDVLVVNAPYVPTGHLARLPREADHEPVLALDGGSDGLDVYRRVLAAAGHWLTQAGILFVEVSRAQVPAAAALLAGAGLAVTTVSDPELGAAVLVGSVGH
jgi:release factor glutamine methyltransferase